MVTEGQGVPQRILRRLHIPWPESDEGKLRDAARMWRQLAATLEHSAAMVNLEASSLTSANYGPAIRAFEAHWEKYGGARGLLMQTAEDAERIASACDEFAGKVEQAKHRIELAAIEVGATLAVGAVGAFITFGASEAAAAGIATSLSATVLGELGILSVSAAEIAAYLAGSALYGAFNAALGAATLDAVKAISGEKLPSGSDELENLLKGTAAGVTSGVAGKGVGVTTEQLARALNEAATSIAGKDPLLSQSIAQLSRSLTGGVGKIGQGLASSAASQIIVNQEVSTKSLVSSGLSKTITQAIERSKYK